MRRLILLCAALLVVAAVAMPWLPGRRLAQRLPRASVVYSRPWVLVPGARVGRSELEAHLERTHYRVAPVTASKPGAGTYRLTSTRWAICLRPFDYPDGREPGGLHIVQVKGTRIERILGPDGETRPALFLQPLQVAVLGAPDAAPRDLIPLDDLPQHLVDAVLVAEDRRFFVHPGVDPVRVAGAALENARERRIVEGGSTLTQQLVKNVWLTPERTWARKLREVAIAFWLELRYSKRQILEAYLNEIYLGQAGARAIHGMGPAARFWFAKDATEVSLAEAALLAGMVRAPSALAPDRHPDRARARRDQILDALYAHGRIEESAYREALEAPVEVHRRRRSRAWAPGFAAQLGRELAEQEEAEGLGAKGLRVFSSLDPHLQHQARAAVVTGLAGLEKGYPLLRRKKDPLQAALIALDPHTGEVLGWVGGRRPTHGGFDRVIGARRQPGSVFKPVVALAAFTLNEREVPTFTLGTLLEDAPLRVDVGGESWEPSNHSGRHRGPVRLRTALEDSLNVPFARLGMEVGLVHVADTARQLGIESPLRPIPSLSLGAFEVTPLEITAAYGVLAAGGQAHEPRTLLAIEQAGRARGALRASARNAFDPRPVHLVTEALLGAVRRGTGKTLGRLGVPGPVAGKTGTSNGFRDAWFVAYTTELVVGVWVGFDDGARVGLTGAQAALPIAAHFLRGALGEQPGRDFRRPPGIEQVSIDPRTGLRAAAHCPGQDEWFMAGTAPSRTCPKPRFNPHDWFDRVFGDRRR
ncbi:MAG: hypothetical protein GY723_17105 [bacterium]|nr:hypothetical protein [bacterium]